MTWTGKIAHAGIFPTLTRCLNCLAIYRVWKTMSWPQTPLTADCHKSWTLSKFESISLPQSCRQSLSTIMTPSPQIQVLFKFYVSTGTYKFIQYYASLLFIEYYASRRTLNATVDSALLVHIRSRVFGSIKWWIQLSEVWLLHYRTFVFGKVGRLRGWLV